MTRGRIVDRLVDTVIRCVNYVNMFAVLIDQGQGAVCSEWSYYHDLKSRFGYHDDALMFTYT